MLNILYIVQPVGSSSAMPATPAPEERRVHFNISSTPSSIMGENQAIGHQSHYQSQAGDPLADDPFVGPRRRNVAADALTQMFFFF